MDQPEAERPIDPHAVRVGVAAASALPGDPVVTVGPPPVPLRLFHPELGEVGVLGGMVSPGKGAGRIPGVARDTTDAASAPDVVEDDPDATGGPGTVLVDGELVAAAIEWIDTDRAIVITGVGEEATRTPVLLGAPRVGPDGVTTREVVVGGWRIDLTLEAERRAALRERSRRGGAAAGRSGPLEVRAIIPGRIVAVSVVPGEAVDAGQQLLVLEAMKMQNELRAPREGTIEKVAVAVGVNVEVGDVLMVIG